LIWAYDPLHPGEEKWFLVRDPLADRLEVWLPVGFARWPVERVLEDKKSELGYSHFEARKYQALMRHWYISMVSHLFLARATERLRGEKSGHHAEPGPRCRQRPGHHAALCQRPAAALPESRQHDLGTHSRSQPASADLIGKPAAANSTPLAYSRARCAPVFHHSVKVRCRIK